MRPVAELSPASCRRLRGIFCDIDDTLTWEGELVPEALDALFAARDAGLRVVPITGRPAGWVDHIARMWPVDGVVGENGGLWFYLEDGQMQRRFQQSKAARKANRERLTELGQLILHKVPGSALASDQPYRELDLAIDFCEDVPRLPPSAIAEIERHFHAAGATCKVSSIHVNGWYGDFDKLTGCRSLVRDRYGEALDPAEWAYFRDSANDEPMFAAFDTTIGVANVRDFLDRMSRHPSWICAKNGGHGFAEGMAVILAQRASGTISD